MPKTITSNAVADGRFGKDDFVYEPANNSYRCPAGAVLTHHATATENGMRLQIYWTSGCPACSLRVHCTTGKERRVTRWEHEDVLETVQCRRDADPQAMRVRRETVEHPFGTLKARMGATHFLTRTLPRVSAEMALQVLAYNLTRVLNIMGSKRLLAAIRA